MTTTAPVRTLTPNEVQHLNFSQTVGLVNEPNMCSGGAATIRSVLHRVPGLGAGDRILEVGSNTGFSVLEMASATKCDVHGIDIEESSVLFSRNKAAALGLDNAHFDVGDGTRIAFPDKHFDMLFASNVTSFIPDRGRAVDEYYRVLKRFGVLAAVPIFYHRRPPARLLAEVEQAIGAPLPRFSRADWEDMFGRPGSELFFSEEYEYLDLSPEQIDAYVAAVLAQPCNDDMSQELKEAAGRRLHYFYTLFNENLGYARYAILLYRKSAPTTFPILHASAPVPGTALSR
ncbi:class I SAM-dependent methyltransferase [Streptomyces sp. SID12501]|uniref:Methyltransferase domain-containing protein n=1 Tax=Streptomyces sp. SID12501 TaxID=2706042 RepID=A0A6B3BTQ0_9ACTN|nr:methyltransferase domain-containing protein [Streptomyces sp. SID12501]NEC87724.1 methyltransferase domain-containing protein [Streptomyces sp. SID12501]